MNFYLNIGLLIAVIITVVVLLKKAKITWYLSQIFIAITLMWVSMQVFRSNQATVHGHPGPKGIEWMHKQWIWAVITALFQLTQVVTRIPFGKLSGRLGSRKAVVRINMVAMLVGLILVLASNFALWAIVIAAITGGMVGATFGLLNQYWSENWNIKRVFYTTMIIFTVPIMSKLFVNTLISIPGIDLTGNIKNTRILFIVTIVITTIGLITYSFFHGEDKESIRLDHSNEVFHKMDAKEFGKISLISIGSACIAFSWEVINQKATLLGNDWMGRNIESILLIVMVSAAILTCIFLIKHMHFIWFTGLSAAVVMTCMITNLVMILTHNAASDTGHIVSAVTILLGSFFSTMYIIAYFGLALHFDHKHQLLILGIFLSIKSFFIGTANLLTGMMVVNARRSSAGLTPDALIIPISVAIALLTLGIFISWFSHSEKRAIIHASIRHEFHHDHYLHKNRMRREQQLKNKQLKISPKKTN